MFPRVIFPNLTHFFTLNLHALRWSIYYWFVIRFSRFQPHLCTSAVFYFFFSSRRRHTRCLSDWSSDVCSSDLLKQPELAATLKRIAKNGASEFYRGETARMLVDEMTKNGGLITLEDLANYKVKVREVLHAKYKNGGHDWELLTAPPPSSGGVAVIESLNML